MIKIIDIDNVKIPSVNRKYNGNFTLTKDYRTFKKIIASNCFCPVIVDPPYAIRIVFSGYIDIDNPVKCILDGISDAGAIANDRDVLSLHVDKTAIGRGKPGAIAVFLGHCEKVMKIC
jgi:hypothetical protein